MGDCFHSSQPSGEPRSLSVRWLGWSEVLAEILHRARHRPEGAIQTRAAPRGSGWLHKSRPTDSVEQLQTDRSLLNHLQHIQQLQFDPQQVGGL